MSFPKQTARNRHQVPLQPFGAINWQLIYRLQQLSIPEKNKQAFAAAQFALTQKRLILHEEHPQWTVEQVDQAARRIVYGISDKDLA